MNIQVNGQRHPLPTAGEATLLHLLRNDLRLNSPKYGCGLGECGSCTVLVDGVAARACVIPARGMVGRHVTTMEGLGQFGGHHPASNVVLRSMLDAVPRPVNQGALPPAGRGALHPVQQAFLDTQAAQCGYCLSGMVMMTVSMLRHNPAPTDEHIRQQLSHNLCRCGTHVEIMQAVKLAAVLMAQAGPPDASPDAADAAGVPGSAAVKVSDGGAGQACTGASSS